MERRQFIKAGVAGAVVVGGGLLWLQSAGKKIDVSIDAALQLLDELAGHPLTGNGAWQPYKVFVHCAQSIEFSLTGYPEHKSDLFKGTVGKAAFSAFHTARKMTHGLSEPIPGAPVIAQDGDLSAALSRLQKAYLDFQNHEGVLAPHFAYGKLSKAEYADAHVMHLYNHLTELA